VTARSAGEASPGTRNAGRDLFDTAMAAGMSARTSEAIIDRMVLYPKRRGHPEEFGRLVRHIVENPYINATTLDIDAGTRMMAR
jgi:hypothetical protein